MKVSEAVAANSERSRGRLHPELQSAPRGPRDIFQRDRDRIIHSIAFRRLRHKTQVFVAPDGDHFRVRLTHSLEVAQIGRTLARALGLNEDLTEALCLAHDLGHPPFGHAGEDALEAALADAGGFDHNAHTMRIVTRLETPYPRFDGLNLSWEALEGLAKHNGPVAHPSWALAEADAAFRLELDSLAGARSAGRRDRRRHRLRQSRHRRRPARRAVHPRRIDRVAAGQTPVGRARRAPSGRRPKTPAGAELVRDLIGRMVNDVLDETERRVRDSGVETIDDVRAAGRPLAGFSEELAGEERALKSFLHARIVRFAASSRRCGSAERRSRRRPRSPPIAPTPGACCPKGARRQGQGGSFAAIGDFIAGMTDRYAIARHEELVGPVNLPAGRF